MRFPGLALVGLAPGLAAPAAAEPVDLGLVLLADATGSTDADEIRFQREGYGLAITHPDVLQAVADTGHGRIAVTCAEWGDLTSRQVVVGWTLIYGRAAPSGATQSARHCCAPRR